MRELGRRSNACSKLLTPEFNASHGAEQRQVNSALQQSRFKPHGSAGEPCGVSEAVHSRQEVAGKLYVARIEALQQRTFPSADVAAEQRQQVADPGKQVQAAKGEHG